MAKKTWDKIPSEKQRSLKDSAARIGESYRTRIRNLSEAAVAAMQKSGLIVHSTDAATLLAWQKQAEVAWASLRGITCPPEMFDEVVRRRNAFRASRLGRSN